jgi:hypothetical protein
VALVQQIKETRKDRVQVHAPVDCMGSTFVGPDGQAYIQLDTAGSATRQEKGKMSQTLQFDERGARALLGLLRQGFPALF